MNYAGGDYFSHSYFSFFIFIKVFVSFRRSNGSEIAITDYKPRVLNFGFIMVIALNFSSHNFKFWTDYLVVKLTTGQPTGQRLL